jgi:hypothetical protein
MENRKNQLDRHLYRAIDSDCDQHHLSVAVWTSVGLSNHNVHVDADISHNGIPKAPILEDIYHLATKNTLST